MEEKKKDNKSNKLPLLLILLLVLAVVIVMTYRQLNNKNTSTACTAVPQSAFGQGQSQAWVEMSSANTAAIGAGFELNYPVDDIPSDYDSVRYWSYSQQINEHRYYSDNKEVFRIAKGKMCGQALYTPDSAYPSTVIAEVGDLSVTEYGDGTTVTAASWANGQYSYFIGSFGTAMTKEDMESFVKAVE